MRFPADDIWKIRLGEQTRLTIPWERKPCPYKVDGLYALERVVEQIERRICGRCEGSGRRKDGRPCKPCAGFGSRVYYVPRVERLDCEERLRVLTVDRILVEQFSDLQALEEGWESAAEFLDCFFATYGEHDWAWTLTFELTSDVVQYMALQHGIKDAPQYVSTPARALDDAPAPSAAEYRNWAELAEAEARRRREIKRLEERRDALEERILQLRRRAA